MALNPRLLVAEISWRWSFGIGAMILFAAGWLRVFGSLPVSDGDTAALRSGNSLLISGALLHILQNVGPSLLRASLIIVPAVLLLVRSMRLPFTVRKTDAICPPKPGLTSTLTGIEFAAERA